MCPTGLRLPYQVSSRRRINTAYLPSRDSYQIFRTERATARFRAGQATDEPESILCPFGDVEGLEGQDRVGIGEIDPAEQPVLTGTDFPARGGIADQHARPWRRLMQSRSAAGIGLAGEFAHAVFIPKGGIGEGERAGEAGVEFLLGDFATAALEAARFQ